MQTIKKGNRGEAVRLLQSKLHLVADGIFGPVTEEAVMDFQKRNSLSVDGIVGPRTWEALDRDTNVSSTNPRIIRKIIVHCTATPEGEDYTVEQIRTIHIAQEYSDIGYHYLIGRDGKIYSGRHEYKIGAHCKGHNSDSIGVSYVGGCPPRTEKDWNRKSKDTRTPAQKAALVGLLRDLRGRYPQARIYGHRDFANKACPSFDATKEYAGL